MYFCVSKTKGAQRKLTTEPVQIKCFEIFAPGLFRWYNRCNQITFITFPLPLIISSYNVTSSTFLSSTTNYHLFFSLARSVFFDIIFWFPVSSFSFLTFPFSTILIYFYCVLNINPHYIFSSSTFVFYQKRASHKEYKTLSNHLLCRGGKTGGGLKKNHWSILIPAVFRQEVWQSVLYRHTHTHTDTDRFPTKTVDFWASKDNNVNGEKGSQGYG